MIPQSVHLVDTKSDGKVKIFMIIFYFIFEFDFKCSKPRTSPTKMKSIISAKNPQ